MSDLRPVLKPEPSQQDLISYYFPKSNWLPPIIGIEHQVERHSIPSPPIQHMMLFASCSRCGSTVEQSHWRNHINWHTNTVEG